MFPSEESNTETENTNEEVVVATVTPEPTEEAKEYKEVFTFSGVGAKKSESFTIQGDKFKVKYSCSGDLCVAWVKEPGSEFPGELVMNTDEPVNDETIIYKSGEFYIDSNSIGSFTITVEDYQ